MTRRLPILFMYMAAALVPAGPAMADDLSEAVHAAIEVALDDLAEYGDFVVATASLETVFDQVIAYAPPRDLSLFRDAAHALRLVSQLARADEPIRLDLLAYLRAEPELARTLSFLVRPRYEDPGPIYALLDRLRRERGELVHREPALAAAVCVVLEQPLSRRVNENRARVPDPVQVLEFFAAHEERLLFKLALPPELLVYIVDVPASVDEMTWALDRFAGDTNVGARFFDVEYDFDYLRTGRDKKVNRAGWNLPNILEHGGVCADQAYFASTVGKAIGVPAAFATGASGDAAHAWVGFLQSDGRRAWWNFDSGRYEAFQAVRGNVFDPQIRRPVPDSSVSLRAELASTRADDRHAAEALADAARRLAALHDSGLPFEPADPTGSGLRRQRGPGSADELALLETALRACPGLAEGWFAVRDLAVGGRLSFEDKKRWAEVLHRLCGQRYPDFYLAVVAPMIETVDELDRQNDLWNAAFRAFSHRADLAAAVRMAQADLWMTHGRPDRAGQCYEDVINRYANAGPFVLRALHDAEAILRERDDRRRILRLYERAWQGTRKPRDTGAFIRQSNWYKVGRLYSERLVEAGQAREAAEVVKQLGR